MRKGGKKGSGVAARTAANQKPQNLTKPGTARVTRSDASSLWFAAVGVGVLAAALLGGGMWELQPAEDAAAEDAGGGPRPPDGPELPAPTPLMRAAMMGDAAMMRELLAAPAARRGSVNAAVTGGLTALHFALTGRMNQMQDDALVRQLQGEHEACMALLLEAGADPMVGHLSALWYAASYRNYEMLALTARAGANTNDRADGGWSLLHEVSASKASGMARFFMKPAIDSRLLQLMRLQPLSSPGLQDNDSGGAEKEEAEQYALPRLQNSCQSDDLVLLIEQGAVVDWQDEKNRSALHIASGDCVLPAVKALLQAGANPNLRGPDGASPLHRAVASGHSALAEQTVATLLEAGADPLQRDDYGRASTDVASSRELREQLLRAATTRTNESNARSASTTGDDAPVVAEGVAPARPMARLSHHDAGGASGGWSTTTVGEGLGRWHGPASAPGYCDFDVVDAAEMDNVRFRRDYLSRRRPVLIKGGVQAWVDGLRWSRQNITQLLRASKVQLTAGQVPYAQHYGIQEKPLSIKGYLGAMDKYLPRLTAVLGEHEHAYANSHKQKGGENKMSAGATASDDVVDRTKLSLLLRVLSNQSAIAALKLPNYVFDGQIEQKLDDFDEELLGVGRGEVPEYLINYDPVLTQFNLGPALTGAQPHFHGDAWNGLVYGRKQWIISRPSRAFFARSGQRAIDWLSTTSKLAFLNTRNDEDEDGGSASPDSDMLCVQEAGDIVYVPRLWGHAVLNLAQSVGAAVEFEQQ